MNIPPQLFDISNDIGLNFIVSLCKSIYVVGYSASCTKKIEFLGNRYGI